MFNKALKELEIISKAVGSLPEYVQGGGGNTSVKLDDRQMAVKASGFKLTQITPHDGYVILDYKNIKEYYKNVDINSGIDFEKESSELVKKNTIETEGLVNLRPSVEAGFHSILKKYVIHTHPVYANILCCSEKGRKLAEEIFSMKDLNFVWLPYIKPGFSLTVAIQSETDKLAAAGRGAPDAVFMENHGLIVTSDDYEHCISLHKEINEIIKGRLEISEPFPAIEIEKIDNGAFRSKTPYVTGFFKSNRVGVGYFDRVLYPDQLVYLNGNISTDGSTGKFDINTATGDIIYKTHFQEALTMEETLLAYLYVVINVEKRHLKLKTMPQQEIEFIRSWESEKYRKALLEKQKG